MATKRVLLFITVGIIGILAALSFASAQTVPPVQGQGIVTGFWNNIRTFFSNLGGGGGECAAFEIVDLAGETDFRFHDGFVGIPYESAVELRFTGEGEEGAKPPFRWTLEAPDSLGFEIVVFEGWLALIKGTPTRAGNYTLKVTAEDSCARGAQTAVKEIPVTIQPAPADYCAPIIIYNEELPRGKVGSAYSVPMRAGPNLDHNGAPLPLRIHSLTDWDFTPFPVQEGESLSADETLGLRIDANGILRGTPTRAGTYDLFIQVRHECPSGIEYTRKALRVVFDPSDEDLSGPVAPTLPTRENVLRGVVNVIINSVTNTLRAVRDTAVSVFPQRQASGTCSALEVATESALPAAALNQSYRAVIAANSSATRPIDWVFVERIGSRLPAGLNFAMDGNQAIISGTPTEEGAFTFTLRARDACTPEPQTILQDFSLIVSRECSPIEINAPSELHNGVEGAPYLAVFALKSPAQIFEPINWAFINKPGARLPQGVEFFTSGAFTYIKGIPRESGDFTFTLNAKDSCPFGAQSTAKDFSFSIHSVPQCTVPVITTESLPDAIVGQGYLQVIKSEGGAQPLTWLIRSQVGPVVFNLPPGLFLSTDGILSGVPEEEGEYILPIETTDSCSTGLQTIAKQLMLVVHPSEIREALPVPEPGTTIPTGPSAAGRIFDEISRPLTIQPKELPDGLQFASYKDAILYPVNSRTTDVKWRVESGALPPGMQLRPLGDGTAVVTGTPTEDGEFNFVVRAREILSDRVHTAYQEYTLTVLGIPLCRPLDILSTLPDGVAGRNYGIHFLQVQISAPRHPTDGIFPPLKWRVAHGALPPGLRLTPGGDIRGIPTESGVYEFTIGVTDSSFPFSCGGKSRLESIKDFTVTIYPAGTSVAPVSVGDLARTHRISIPREPARPPKPTIPTESGAPNIVTQIVQRFIDQILPTTAPCPECPPQPNVCSLSAGVASTEPIPIIPNFETTIPEIQTNLISNPQGGFALTYDCRGDVAGTNGKGCTIQTSTGITVGSGVRGVGTVNLNLAHLSGLAESIQFQIYDHNGDRCAESDTVTIDPNSQYVPPQPEPESEPTIIVPPPTTTQPPTPTAPPAPPAEPASLRQNTGAFFSPSSTINPGGGLGNVISRSRLTQGKGRLQIQLGVSGGPLTRFEPLRLQYGITFTRYSVSPSIFGPPQVSKTGNANCQLISTLGQWRDLPTSGPISFDGSMPLANSTAMTSSPIGGISQVLVKRNDFRARATVNAGQSATWDFPITVTSIVPTTIDRKILDELSRFDPRTQPGQSYIKYDPSVCFRVVRGSGQPLDSYGSYPIVDYP